MQTVTVPGFSDYRIKGSKFFGYLHPAKGQQEIEAVLEKIRTEHSTATHHCYAWRVSPAKPEEFSQDDGEPSGTAGPPILNALRSHNLVNCLLVSIRYYGGSKLGKKGLIDAYGTSAMLSIENAVTGRLIEVIRYRISFPYSLQPAIDKLKNDFPVIEISATYLENVEMVLAIPAGSHSAFHRVLTSLEHRLTGFEELGTSFRAE